ncbi:hypothetical protein T552_02413 [Pneumocystis carinii B80]|uniref:Coiled-coil SMC6 And NSE5 INteracting (CANIN) domain-containing protein n=1 Tax=Pneumocystis carinii (strain B80) TaxID=1408658 RepID=A0A0W4ZGC2_PNEC8|nr:hypothetical protein T552_02413 [Pneumocystis carinii B80]KTW27435.1 hypothetical protein T552_02413 [Pneumocystis carinii B80]
MSLNDKSSIKNRKTKNTIITDFFQPKSCSTTSKLSEFHEKKDFLDNDKDLENKLTINYDFEKLNNQKNQEETLKSTTSNYQFSLETLLKDQENRKKRYESFNRLEKFLNNETTHLENSSSHIGSRIEMVIGKKKGQELQAVLDDINIFRKQFRWSFFGNNIEKMVPEDIPIEDFGLKRDILTFEKEQFPFLLITGYFSDIVDSGKKFSMKFVQWLLDNISLEKNEMMLYGYFSVLLKIYSSPEQMHVLSEFQIRRVFLFLGAVDEAIDIKSPINSVNIEDINYNIDRNYHSKIINLKLVLDLLRTALLHSRIKKHQTILYIFSIILKLYMDNNCSFYLGSSLYLCFLQLFDTISNAEFQTMALELFNVAYNITKNSFMRLSILQSLPIGHAYGRILRFGLAFSMLLNIDAPPNNFPHSYAFPFSKIFDHIQMSRPFFPIDSDTDYFELCIAIYLLDYIFFQPSYQDDQDIKKICKLLKHIYEKISDCRTAFIVRTEAKAKIQKLLLRLTHTYEDSSKIHQSTLEYHFNKI